MPLQVGIYCANCFSLLGFGAEGSGIEWVKQCGRCTQRALEAQLVEQEREALWLPRACAGPDCDVTFKPGMSEQRFCSDRCRSRAHRREKAARQNGTGVRAADVVG